MNLKITLSHHAEDLTRLREEWQALQTRSSARGIYLTWEWVSTWWAHFGADKQLWLLQARDAEGRLVGLAPLNLADYQPQLGSFEGRSWRQLQIIGTQHNCEHLGFLLEPGREAEIINAFIKMLKRHQRAWDVLHLAGLASDSPSLAMLQSLDIPWERSTKMIAPYIKLTNDWEEYFNRLGSLKRKAQRKRVRLLDKDFPENWAFEQITASHELRPTLDKLVELHQAVWEERGEPGAFGDPQRKAFLYALAERFLEAGWLRLYHVSLDREMTAVLYSYEYRGRVYDLVSGVNWDYRDYNVGHILTQYAIHNAVNNGVDEYDFLWGNEPYKYEWRAEDREHLSLTWFASPMARFQNIGFRAARKAKYRARKLLHDLKNPQSEPQRQPDPEIE